MEKKKIIFLICGAALACFAYAAYILVRPTHDTNPGGQDNLNQLPAESRESKDVFMSGVSGNDFAYLEIRDLPSTLDPGYFQSAVMHDDKIYVASVGHILVYDKQGALIGMSNPKIFDCPGDFETPAVLALAGETLYAACWNTGIKEIHLTTNRLGMTYDSSNGLKNTQNLKPVVDGDTVWVSTFNGVARINRQQKAISFYNDIFENCHEDNAVVYAANGEAWATSLSGCGASHFNNATLEWEKFGPDDFNRDALDRVDFNDFVVSSAGVYAAYQDGGPDDTVLAKLDADGKTWTRLFRTSHAEFPAEAAAHLPAKETYLTSYHTSEWPNVTWHIKNGDEWIELPLPQRRYLAVSRLDGNRYFLLSTAGIEQLSDGQPFPDMKVAAYFNPTNGRIMLSEDGRFVVALSDVIEEMGGTWLKTNVAVYDTRSKMGFAGEIAGKESGTPPQSGLLKSPKDFTMAVYDDMLQVAQGSETPLLIDLEAKTFTY